MAGAAGLVFSIIQRAGQLRDALQHNKCVAVDVHPIQDSIGSHFRNGRRLEAVIQDLGDRPNGRTRKAGIIRMPADSDPLVHRGGGKR